MSHAIQVHALFYASQMTIRFHAVATGLIVLVDFAFILELSVSHTFIYFGYIRRELDTRESYLI